MATDKGNVIDIKAALTGERLLRQYAPEAIEFLYKVMTDEHVAIEVRIQCAVCLATDASTINED